MRRQDHTTSKKLRTVARAALLPALTLVGLGLAFPDLARAQEPGSPLAEEIDRRAAEVESKVIEWRRDIHRNPELGNREFETAAKVAAHLESLDIAVQTGSRAYRCRRPARGEGAPGR